MLAATIIMANLPVYATSKLSWSRAAFQSASVCTFSGFPTSWIGVSNIHLSQQWVVIVATAMSLLCAWLVAGWAMSPMAGRARPGPWLAVGVGVMAIATAVATMLAGPPSTGAMLQDLSRLAGSGLRWDEAADLRTLWSSALPLAIVGLFLPYLLLTRSDAGRQFMLRAFAAAAVWFVVSTAIMGTAHAALGGSDVLKAATMSIDGRHLGAARYISDASAVERWIMVALGFVGTLPGGTGGGASPLAVGVLAAAAWSGITGRPVGRVAAVAIVWIALHFTLWLGTLLCLTATLPEVPGDRLAVLATGATSNVGVAVDHVGAVATDGFVLALSMMLGRLLPVIMLAWLVRVWTSEIEAGKRKTPRDRGEASGQ